MQKTPKKFTGKTDWKRLETMTDEDIDYSDSPPTDEAFWADAELVIPAKKQISIRLDAEVIDWFKTQGKGYQSRINAVLQSYIQHHRTS